MPGLLFAPGSGVGEWWVLKTPPSREECNQGGGGKEAQEWPCTSGRGQHSACSYQQGVGQHGLREGLCNEPEGRVLTPSRVRAVCGGFTNCPMPQQ